MATIDPVCGMTVDPATAKATAEHAGTTYYFCCGGCAQKFRTAPDQYLKPRSTGPVLVTLGAPRAAAPVPALPTSVAAPASEIKSRSTRLRLPKLLRRPRANARSVSDLRNGARTGNSDHADQDRLHLPDASADQSPGPGKLSYLRNDARVADHHRNRRRES